MKYDQLRRKALRDALLDMGYSTAHASKIVIGEHRPSLDNMVKIEDHLGIPARAWVTAEVAIAAYWRRVVAEEYVRLNPFGIGGQPNPPSP